MTLSLSAKYRVWIAGLFFNITWAQLLLPLSVRAEGTVSHVAAFDTHGSKRASAFRRWLPEEPETRGSISSTKSTSALAAAAKKTGQEDEDRKWDGIGGPGQPEMSSFQSVNGNNMVDLFSGDFSYNIPLMDVGGYPINIHYNSGITMDQEASWVGLGFNINPGTITRNMRGLPDDFNGKDSITKTQSIKPNRTIGVKLNAQAELKGAPLKLGWGIGIFHNSYNGWGSEQSFNAAVSLAVKQGGSLQGDTSSLRLGAGLGLSNNSQTGLSVSPSLNVRLMKMVGEEGFRTSAMGISTGYHSRAGWTGLTIDAFRTKLPQWINNYSWMPGMSINISFAQPTVTPTIQMPTTSSNYAFHLKTGGQITALFPNAFVEGYVNVQEIKAQDQVQKRPAYGYLYYTDAAANGNALLDVNREKELQFNYKTTPNIAIPQYTYDVYAISGEGTGGNIRPYRGDAGYMRDHYMRTRNGNNSFSLELGAGNFLHGGFAYDYVNAYTENSEWGSANLLRDNLRFQPADKLYQPVYFRNPAEKTSNTAAYYQQVGDDALLRVKLEKSPLSNVRAQSSFVKYQNGHRAGELPVSGVIRKQERDKRSQVVTYLRAQEASVYGFDKVITSYKENTLPLQSCSDSVETIQRVDNAVHLGHHLSEIDVLNADGRRYIYGIPAYNVEQKDVTFSVDPEPDPLKLDSGLVAYNANGSNPDNSVRNKKGKENYFNQEQIPAYAHSFLLTALLSPDYVDVKGDGITEDDLGDGVKFNYTRVYGPGEDYFAWRTPGSPESATYNEGLKSYRRDDKGFYSYGKKEVWYTHSIESKTMIALFKLGADRKDGYAAAGENGGLNVAKSLRKLNQIELYSKADLLKNGKKARPVKVVHFEYNYELCKGYNNRDNVGKLTLKKIWFSYNGNEKGKQNPYVFNYNAGNPSYHPKKYDRWGNYKNESSNPGGLSNADFPYAVQDSAIAAQNAGAWHLSDIKLPSGGRMRVTYESDDYAFVQNKRAMQMFSVAGFGASPSAAPSSMLYASADAQYEYVFVDASVPFNDANDVLKKYLLGNEWLYLKLAVVMPSDRWGRGYELVPLYGKLQSYGKVPGVNRFWLKFEPVEGMTPMVRSAFQFLRNNLPSKAFPTSEPGDNISVWDAVKMLVSSIGEIQNATKGFEQKSMTRGWCQSVVLPASFIRLNSPTYKKLGGGLRVKRVEVFDNWNSMTGQKEAVYGQEYSYRTSIEVDGKKEVISSGVATYEPMIGGEENPFRQPIPYAEKLAPAAPVSYLYSEMPLGESYFPGAAVGYSKVRVRTINAKAKSANGWEETEFYTSRDFPTQVEHTLLDQEAKTRYAPKLQNLLKIYYVDRMTVSQGFKVELNDMNGKVKRTASYAENDSLNPVSYTLNFYKVDNDRSAVQKLNNTVWVVDSVNGKINPNGTIGKDIELINDFRQQFSSSVSGGISPNLDLFFIGPFPIPLPSLFKFPQFTENQFRSAATVKLVQRYGILDSVVVKDKSSVVSTKNLLYDGETGEVVLSRTQNEFNDPVYNFSYPAHWAYSGMGMAYKNVHAEFFNLQVIEGRLFNANGSVFPAETYFESGDELYVNGRWMPHGSGANCLSLINVPLVRIPLPSRVWVMDAQKAFPRDKGLYLIDANGRPITGSISTLKILRSGRRNLLNASVGSILAMENPIRYTANGDYRLVFDSTSKVINASVATYKDQWKVEQSYHQVDSCFSFADSNTVYLRSASALARMKWEVRHPERHLVDQTVLLNTPGNLTQVLVASHDLIPEGGRNGTSGREYFTKGIMKFDFSQIPSNAKISSAKLGVQLTDHGTVWPRETVRFSCGPFTTCQRSNTDWASDHRSYGGDNDSWHSVIRRIDKYWDKTFKYFNYSVTHQNEVPINSVPTGGPIDEFDLTNLVRDVVEGGQPYYGFMLELQNPINRTNYPAFYSLVSNESHFPSPILQVSYQTVRDSCASVCRADIDSVNNPYRWGILGNWRMERAFTYYHDRKESDAASPETDIRREGLLKSFAPFWKFTDSVLLAAPDTTKWVWNSALSAYNRKGFEIENYDALGRYNAGLYGYNQTLPVAVAQNAKYREILFDGFEDYFYKSRNCVACETPRGFDFLKGQSNVSISDQESHTGQYSLRVPAGYESKLSIALTDSDRVDSIHFNIDSSEYYAVTVVGKGTGLKGSYTGHPIVNGDCDFKSRYTGERIDATVDFNWGGVSPFPGMCLRKDHEGGNNYEVYWSGKVQAPYTGTYSFYLDKSPGWGVVSVTVNGMSRQTNTGTNNYATALTLPGVYLNQGELCEISVGFTKLRYTNADVHLSWSSESFTKQIIPQRFLYPIGATADTIGSVVTTLKQYCIKTSADTAVNFLQPAFSPSKGGRIVVAGWVKMEGADCSVAPALQDVVVASFDEGTSFSLQKTGVRIEGWQRYEAVLDIPRNAGKLSLRLRGNGRTVFVDDIRVQPYNSSLKGYVYNATSLRLMAELDENNYASFYEYDDDGTLIRVKKETEKGVLTIKETRSALLKD